MVPFKLCMVILVSFLYFGIANASPIKRNEGFWVTKLTSYKAALGLNWNGNKSIDATTLNCSSHTPSSTDPQSATCLAPMANMLSAPLIPPNQITDNLNWRTSSIVPQKQIVNSQQWCSAGPTRDLGAVTKLCDSVPYSFLLRKANTKDITVGSARQYHWTGAPLLPLNPGLKADFPAVCQRWSAGNTAFEVCNFDTTKPLLIERDLGDVCRATMASCNGNIGSIVQYPESAMSEDPLAVIEKKYAGMTRGPVANEKQQRGAWWANYTGNYVECDSYKKPNWFVRIFKPYRKCWKVIDPEGYWKEKW